MERKNRIFGVETEYGVAFWDNKARMFSRDDLVFKFMNFAVGGSNQFLPNGARVYLDVGSHIETATPECVSARQAVVYEKALEKMIADKARKFNEYLAPGWRLTLLKNNADFSGNSYGCHENYLMPSDLWKELAFEKSGYFSGIFQLFLAIRPVLCGSGFVTSAGRFLFSRRAMFIRNITGSLSQGDRPMIHQKDESLSHPDSGLSRLHLLIADSNMSEFSAYLRMGTTHLVLRALEKLFREKSFPANYGIFASKFNAIELLRKVNEDAARAGFYPAGLFRKVSVCDLHNLLINFVNDALHSVISPEEKEILALWRECVEKIKEGDEDYLSCRLDWAIKKKMMERKLERSGIDPEILVCRRIIGAGFFPAEFSRLQMMDLLYHDISDSGLYNRLAASNAVEKLSLAGEIDNAAIAPPATRAAWRGGIIGYFNDKLGRRVNATLHNECWTNISVAVEDKAFRFANYDPYETGWSGAKSLMDKLAN